MSATETIATCQRCQQQFAAHELNLTASGQVCNLCEAGVAGDELSASTFNRARNAVIGAGVGLAVAFFVSMRSKSSSGYSMGGHGSETTQVSADIPGLLGAGIALLFVLVGLASVFTAKGIDDTPEERSAMLKRKIIYAVILVGIGALAGLELVDALPHTKTRSF